MSEDTSPPHEEVQRTCRICGATAAHPQYTVREMMFGFRDAFTYFQCQQCECLQIAEIPAAIAKYYPENYYSMSGGLPRPPARLLRSLRQFGATVRMRHALPFGGRRQDTYAWVRGTGIERQSAILDVGCGRGLLLHELWLDGFSNLTGVDPFIEKSVRYDSGIAIHKCSLAEVDGTFDLVMMHHSFEHMPDPHAALAAAAARLRPDGCLLIRIPIVPSLAFRTYGVHWFQLDAPRHFYLHSRKSMQRAAAQANLQIDRVVYDSRASQFWGSEQYRNDIPHRSERSYGENPRASIFSMKQIRTWKRLARRVNASGDGDAACFYLSLKS